MTPSHPRPLATRLAAPLALAVAASVVLGSSLAGAAVGSKSSAKASTTCKQLTKEQIQPLVADPITHVTVQPANDAYYGATAKKVGQQCNFATESEEAALAVTVIAGPSAAKAYAADVTGFHGAVRVTGVGNKAARAHVDAKGSAATTALTSLKGHTYCRVVPGDGDIPGTEALEEAAGFSPDIGDAAYAEIAAAIGTVCNRVYGSGNTTPDLSKLVAAAANAPTATTSDSIGGQDCCTTP